MGFHAEPDHDAGALTLMVGIVIDDAIIVLENIFRFIEESGCRRSGRRSSGTREIGLAVMATTLIAAGCVSAGRLHGRNRGTLHELVRLRRRRSRSQCRCWCHLLTLTPMLSSRFIKAPEMSKAEGHSSKDSLVFHWLDLHYTRMLKWSMAHRKTVYRDERADDAEHRAAIHDGRQELPAGGRSGAVQRSRYELRRGLHCAADDRDGGARSHTISATCRASRIRWRRRAEARTNR